MIDGLAATESVERRGEPRFRVLLRSRLVYEHGLISVDAVVKDSSEHGARLVLSKPQALPSHLFLVDMRAGVAHEAQIIWRRLPEIGVRFARSHDLRTAESGELASLRQMWRALATA